MAIIIPSSAEFLTQLVNPAARAIVLAGTAGLALTVLRVKATSARLFAWKTVLYAALAMPLLGLALPTITIPAPPVLGSMTRPLPAQPNDNGRHALQPQIAVNRFAHRTASTATESTPVSRDLEQIPTANAASVVKPSISAIDSAAVAMAFYLVVSSLFLIRMAIGVLLAHRLKHTANEIRDEHLTAHVAWCARSFGVATTPIVAEAEVIAVPVTMGVLRPVILLPSDWREWEDAKIEAVIAHEMSHVVRRDTLTQHFSLLHRAIFWFSPLAWWLDRHLAELAERASDEAALSCGTNSSDYAKVLLGFFETLHTAPRRIWWQGVAMAKIGQAERRLERILAWKHSKGAITMGLKKSVTVTIIALAVPAIFLAASVQPAQDRPSQHTQNLPAPPLPAKPSAAAYPNVPTEPIFAPAQGIAVAPPAAISQGGIPSLAPVAPIAPMSALAPAAPWSGQSGRAAGYSYAYGYDDDERFVIVSGNSDSLTMSGSTQDAHHVERLRKQIPGDFIWFQRDEKSYIIRDQATIDRARGFWAPQEELGKKQEELGKQQEALGKQQEAIGRKMEQVRVNVPDMSGELEKLKAELKALGPTATQEQLGNIQSEIGELQSRIGDVQSKAGEQQSKIGEEMGALGEQQGKLGEQQGELGRQQEKLAKEAVRKMKELFDESIKDGKAQPEPQISQGGTI
jgi:beta-lactamase regulating signal transducer with metallopeptidase domain